VLGTAALAMMQPEALLPPPFPANAPWRLYLSNMAVANSHRRRGLARTLLRAAERVGERGRAARGFAIVRGFGPVCRPRQARCGGAWSAERCAWHKQ
jgi:ribosomal protein S18 acetylase RimI-like enzyme